MGVMDVRKAWRGILLAVLVFCVATPCLAAPAAPAAPAAGGAGAAQAEAPIQGQPIPSELRYQGKPIRIGDPVQTAIDILGKPIRSAAMQNYCWRDRWDIYGPEAIVKALPDNKQIFAFVIRKLPGFTTPEGVGVGTAREKVIQTYGTKYKRYRRKDFVMYYGGGGPDAPYLSFVISARTDKVIHFSLGVPPKYTTKKKK